ncbi:unnamed protein product, partial [Effrenium voratum]
VCLHTFAQLRSRDTALFKVITRYLLREERAPELTAAHVASLLYSHVRMLHSEKGLLRLAHLRLSEDAWGVSDLATALQALATLRADNVRLSTASARVVAREAPQAPLPLLGDLLEERGNPQLWGIVVSWVVLRSAVAGSLAGVLVIFRDVSFALVYCSPEALHGSKTLMMTLLLLSSGGSQLVYSYRHSLPTVISCTSSSAVPFQSIMAASIASKMPDAAPVLVLATFAMTAVGYGLVLLVLSFLPHLDLLKSAFPQPVMLAFFCVVGVGMLQSALELVVGDLWDADELKAQQIFLTLSAGLVNRLGPKLLPFGP